MKRLLVLASLIAAPRGAAAQQAALVRGTVRDSATRQPLQDAQVTASPAGRTVLTDAAGRYVLGGLAAGTVVVRVRRFGYSPADDSRCRRKPSGTGTSLVRSARNTVGAAA